MKLFPGLNSYFLNMSLLRKLTIAYTIAILFPAAIVGTYMYLQFEKNIKQEIIKSSRQALSQVTDNINQKILTADKVSGSVGYNTAVIDFLSKKFVLSEQTLDTYNQYISPLITNTENINQDSIYRVAIYTSNHSIPDLGDIIYRDNRIINQEWYEKFKSERNVTTWIYPNGKGLTESYVGMNDLVCTLVKKIHNGSGTYLGVIAIDVLLAETLSNAKELVDSKEGYSILDSYDNVIYAIGTYEAGLEQTLFRKHINSKQGYFVNDDVLYVYDTLEKIDVKIVRRGSIETLVKQFNNTAKYVALAVIFGLIVLVLLTYVILRIIFSRLRQIVQTMNTVAAGNFDIRIPIDSTDEVGQLANDFNILISKINGLVTDVLIKETAQKDAQLMALQYQINPHFIYNTIEIFRMRMELEKNYETADAITDFGEMLRYNMHSKFKYATIQDEVEHVGNYINLQKLRYGDRIECKTILPDYLKKYQIVKFLLQPIVENCIKHGLNNCKKNIRIDIDVKVDKENLLVMVKDNGVGINPKRLEEINYSLRYSKYNSKMNGRDGSIGLKNINERIKLFYGNQYYIQVDSVMDESTKVIVRIPFVNSEDDEYAEGANR